MVYLKSVENVITLGKLIGLLFLFCLPFLSIMFKTPTTRRSVEHCTSHADGAWLNELGWSQ